MRCFAAVYGNAAAPGVSVGLFDSGARLVNWNVYPFVSPPDDVQVFGSAFSPQGKVLVVPLGDSIEFWDADSGTLRARLMTPEELNTPVTPNPAQTMLAIDGTGQTIFAGSKPGLTVINLPEPLDSMPSQAWLPLAKPGRPGLASAVQRESGKSRP